MASSKVRKEEAELRQIAKQSRLARKEAQARGRKQKQREARARARAEVAPTPTAAQPAPRKRQAAIILPSEVQELRQRLGATESAAAAPAQAPTPSKKKSGKKGGAAKAQGVTSATPGLTTSATAAAGGAPAYPVPNHHVELHFKKRQILVDVVLHHIPHQKIDVSETTPTRLVVDTTKHTKKFRLELPFPHGMRVKPSEAEYELEGGVLHCALPLDGEEVPAELQEKWDAMVEQMRQQKALRFRTSQDGELTVRMRQALLAKDPAAQAALHAARRPDVKRARDSEEAPELEEAAADTEVSERRARVAKASTAKAKTAAAGTPEPPTSRKAPARAKASSGAGEAAGEAKPDVFSADHAKAMEAARAAASAAKVSIRDRVRLAKEVQAQRQQRMQVRSARREQKQDRKQASFMRVLDEQRRQLAAKAQLAAATAEAEKQRLVAKQTGGTPAKSVSFA